MNKVAIILAGCGQNDGSETHETILTLLTLSQENISWDAFAPNIPQALVFDHLHRHHAKENRNVLVESARLVRGKIRPLNEASPELYDAIIIPGGFGAVSNLCNYSEKGINFTFQLDFENFIFKAAKLKKPIGFICIAPIMIPKIYPNQPKMTIGNDPDMAKQMNFLGARHINCLATEVVIDRENMIVSTPANMNAKNISEVYQGIHKLVQELKNLVMTI